MQPCNADYNVEDFTGRECPRCKRMTFDQKHTKQGKRWVGYCFTCNYSTYPERRNTMLEELKRFDADRLDIDEMVVLSKFARDLRTEYEQLGLEVPEWLDDQTRSVRLAIKARTQDLIAKRLKELKAKRANLRTTEERRSDLDKDIERYEKLASAV